jgi:hypothetical protein
MASASNMWKFEPLQSQKKAAAGDSESFREQSRGYRRVRSQVNSEDEAHLIVSFAFGAGGLGESGNGGEPSIAAVRNVWADEEVISRLGAVPARQEDFV